MDLLRQAIFLDTETTGLHRGAGMHELAFFDQDLGTVHSYVIKPNMVMSQVHGSQDELGLSTSPGDQHVRMKVGSWGEVIRNEMHALGEAPRPGESSMQALARVNPFLHKSLEAGLYPHLGGDIETLESIQTRTAALKAKGALLQQQADLTIGQVLNKIPEHMRPGSTVWIANSAFESKQLGAQLAAGYGEVADRIAGKLETRPTGSDLFYVTGAQVNESIAKARLTGDWTGVYEAYRAHTPAAGEVAVRDVLHVTRALRSHGEKLGMVRPGRSGLSIDINAQLLSKVFGDDLSKEVHRAAEDAAIHEPYVLRKQVEMIEALREVNAGRGAGLLAEAKQGRGILSKVSQFFGMLDQLSPELDERAVVQRLARAQREIADHGYATMQSGVRAVYKESKVTPSGQDVLEPRVLYGHKQYSSLGEVSQAIAGQYSVPGERIAKHVEALGSMDRAGVTEYESQVLKRLDRAIDGHKAWNVKQADLGALVRRNSRRGMSEVLQGLKTGRAAMIAGAVGLGITAMGVVGTMAGRTGSGQQEQSVLSYGYDQWLARKQMEGMRHDGPVGASRHRNTDFGSPYQGPMLSLDILADQQIYQEREKWLRTQYGAVHQGPDGIMSRIFKFPTSGYRFVGGTRAMQAGEFAGLQGDNLRVLDIDPSRYNIKMEDPDTITLQRRGLIGAIQSFMGRGRYSFRLEGIDSPEVKHGAREAQPGAEIAAQAAQAMVAGKSLQMVINAGDSTYGRQLGVLFVDGENYNLQAVQRGYAAFLPFGKQQNAMIDWKMYRAAEDKAFDSSRGIWAEPWTKAFKTAADASGSRPTFNTFSQINKVAASSGAMSFLSVMEGAQGAGWNASTETAARAVGMGLKGKFIGDDRVTPTIVSQHNAPHKNYLVEQLRDVASFTKTRGSGRNPNKFNSGNLRKLDSTMAVDTMGTTNSVHTRRSAYTFQQYNTRSAMRRSAMAAAQRDANRNVFQTGIGHHRM